AKFCLPLEERPCKAFGACIGSHLVSHLGHQLPKQCDLIFMEPGSLPLEWSQPGGQVRYCSRRHCHGVHRFSYASPEFCEMSAIFGPRVMCAFAHLHRGETEV